MKTIKITPRGYCHGVVGAIRLTQKAAMDEKTKKPIYILGMIVHNEHIVNELEKLGVITIDNKSKTRLELIDEIDSGTIIFTAHGISEKVKQKAISKGLDIIDATCKDVLVTHELIKSGVEDNKKIIYIGKKGHPETEGAISDYDKETCFLVTSLNDINLIPFDKKDTIIITNQTTLSQWDIMGLVDEIKNQFINATYFNEICKATQIRQEAISKVTNVDLIIVVGDKRSNNTKKLREIGESYAGIESIQIANYKDINPEWLKNKQNVAVTSGASTPTSITKAVIEYLEQFDYDDQTTYNFQPEINNILPVIN